MVGKTSILVRFHKWRLRNLSERNFLLILSVIIGVIVGIVATIIKNTVWLTQRLVGHIVNILPNDSIEVIAEKFESSGRFNIAVIDEEKYLGFISRARIFYHTGEISGIYLIINSLKK